MLGMNPPCVCSLKQLLALIVLFPGVQLLFFDIFKGNVVSECERATLELALRESKFIFIGGGAEYLNQKVETYEIEKSQRPFECITSRIQGSKLRIFERTPEYQKLKQQCDSGQELVECDSEYPYRTIDGVCNNLFNVKWGSALSCLKHFLPPSYEGVSDFRRSVCGFRLPEPRTLSLTIFKNAEKLSHDLNNIFTFFAQLVSHDVGDIATSTIGSERIDCCSERFRRHPQCAPIRIPRNDPYYSKLNVNCLNFVRAVPCRNCSLGKRNTLSRTTPFIDCSFMYGVSEEQAESLRRNDGTGKMLVQRKAAGELLPPDVNAGSRCGSERNREYCFETGDRRANQQTPLSSFQTIFVREHNRIASILKQLNPRWREEKIYQETRKIVIAEMQLIVYKEFLPLLIGPHYMSTYNLAVSRGSTVYSPTVNPNLYAEFVYGAFRLHSVIPNVVTEVGVDGGKREFSEFIKESAAPIYHGEMDKLLQGMCESASGLFDRYITKDLTGPLFESPTSPGIDLISIDIQRGRDGGMPPYTEVIRYLSNGKINIETFSDLTAIFRPADVELLESLYCDPRDIDYFVGMHFERPGKNSVLWQSAAEIVAKQFSNWKFGDRFYFEHSGNFNKNQLRALKQVSLATILCENTDFQLVQERAMQFPSVRNPIKHCDSIPKLNLDFWEI